jgi:TP901 family phage tail tape measure protein
MANDQLDLFISLGLEEESAKKIVKETQEVIDKATDTKKAKANFGRIGKAVLLLKGPLGTIAKLVAKAFSVAAIMQFLNAVDESRRTLIRLTGATGDSLTKLFQDTRAVYTKVPEDLKKVGQTVGTLNTLLGIHGEQLQKISKYTLDFARANGVDAAQAAELVSQTLNRFQLPAELATAVMDRLNVAGQATGASVTEMANNLLQSGPALTLLGKTFDEQIAIMASFERYGININEHITRLNLSVGRFAKRGLRDGKNAFEGFVATIKEAPNELEAIEIAVDVLGRRGAQLARDIRQGVFEIDDLKRALEESKGSVENTEEAGRTLGDEFRIFGGILKNDVIPVINLLKKVLADTIFVARQFYESLTLPFRKGGKAEIILRQAEGELKRLERGKAFLLTEGGMTAEEYDNRIKELQETLKPRRIENIFAGLQESADSEKVRTLLSELNAVFDKDKEDAPIILTAEQLLQMENERISLLKTALDLGIATKEEAREALALVVRAQQMLQTGVADTAERIRQKNIESSIMETMGLGITSRPLADSFRTIQDFQLDQRLQNITALPSGMALLPDMRELEKQWMEANEHFIAGAEATAYGIESAFGDAFSALINEMDGLSAATEALFKGMGRAAAMGVAEIARVKARQALAEAVQLTATSFAALAVGNAKGAALAGKAAAKYAASAAMWSALAGSVAGLSAGGGRGGGAGAAGAMSDTSVTQAGPDINIYLDGVDPSNPRHQALVGETYRMYQQRTGSNVRLASRR